MSLKNKIVVVIAILGFCSIASAQVGIGTIAPAISAQLDIVSANKGLLIPRLSLTATSNQSPVTGAITSSLLVYNTATANDVSPGFYYWQINKWVRLVAKSDPVTFNETLTTLTYNAATNALTYKDENGVSNILQLVGQTGPQGVPGNDGATGPQGPQGIPGNNGAIGPQGPQGVQGAPGINGATGPQGLQGVAGNDGATGPQGIQGSPGNDGATGPQGLQGVAGNDGATGPQGIQGIPGNDGATGATGPQGVQGIPGNDGAAGAQGGIGLIVNGTNTTVSGTGTTTDPYKIDTPSIPVTTVSNTSIANSLNTTVNGITDISVPIINSNALDAVNGNLISTVNGVASTPAVPVLITANNALTVSNGNVQLGGNLTQPTSITTDVANTLAVTGLQAGATSDNILVTDISGILKSITPTSLNANNWSILGNAGTNAAANFLGTTDAQSLQFRISNTNAGILSTTVTAFGYNALNPVSTGGGNTAFGTTALGANTSGFSNTAMGYSALAVNTIGFSNTAVGSSALAKNVDGASNTAFGSIALQSNTSGSTNTAVGSAALTRNTTGSFNTGVGWQSLTSNIGGTYNTGLGYGAVSANTTGTWNTGLGANALKGNLIGTGNTAIGYNALLATQGNSNIAIGYLAGNLITTGSSNILIGASVNGTVPSAANEMNIGNTLYGTAVNNAIGTGRIGINNVAPTNTLHVTSTANPVRFEGLQTGLPTDNMVVADATGVLKIVSRNNSFSAKIPLEITATIAPPTKPTAPETDFMRYRDIGNNEIEVDFLFSSRASSGAVNGDGYYLFSLPDGLQFNFSENPVYSGEILGNVPYLDYALRNATVMFYMNVSFLGNFGSYIIPYDATKFRIIVSNDSESIGMNADRTPLTLDRIIIGGRFTFTKQ